MSSDSGARRFFTRRQPHRPSRQRGSFAVMTVITLLVMISTLGAVDIGNVFFVRRDMQRIADVSALAAVQRMGDDCLSSTSQTQITAQSNATANGLNTNNGDTIKVGCGRWDTTDNPAPSYYVSATASMTQLNAVQVKVTRKVPYFFLGPSRTVSAISTARATNIDTFSVGATLASLGGTGCSGSDVPSGNAGLVNALLGALLGGSLNLNIASYQALACTNIKIGDLMAAANVGTVNQLLAMQVTLPKLVNLAATALSSTNVVNANLQAGLSASALKTIAGANISAATINVGNQSGNGLLNVSLANTQAAANATVDLLDLLLVGAEIAQTGQPAVALNLSVPLGGLTGTQLQVQIISPPTIAIGEGGQDPVTGQWRTKASTAEVGLYLVVDLGTQQLPIVGALLSIINTGIDVKLPIYLQVGTGTAWLNSTQCAQTLAQSTAVITAQPGIANLCIGQPPLNSAGLMSLSSSYSCSSPGQIINAPVLGLATLTASLSNVSVQVQGTEQTNTFSGVSGLDSDYWTINSNALGSALSSALTQLSNAKITVSLSLFGVISLPSNFVSTLLGILTPILSPLLTSLDQIIVPLLQLLGVQVGAATVHQISLTCGVAQTVY